MTYQRDQYPFEGVCLYQGTGIEDNNGGEAPLLFPNPASTSIFIKLSTGAERAYNLTFSDIWGRNVKEVAHYNSEELIDIEALPAGIYLITGWLDESLVWRQAFVKNRFSLLAQNFLQS